ncbi:class I SAM-dependent methyltransferase [Neptuniibacter sp.]|uniref:class I SAM-dependent rRNA methyltransferase n=1 Tax=Neptuniibacter sp. TaxID=1962643 RepID=UPI002639E435|nr:class I SAM-dependent methyltransferase [Neptuniibacter sp.]MCP4598807.1 class I SAM-dependent rRNA methyltransferase [Neptuniibacter sp.]
MSDLHSLLKQASDNRIELLQQLNTENTNCYRLFHGTNEGLSGLTVDRYGPQLLVQTFHESLHDAELETIQQHYADQFAIEEFVYNDRSSKNSRRVDESDKRGQQLVGQELGVNYRVKGKHAGQDPFLFLDMRVGRRFVLANAQNKSVLNLFSYTCGVGICAAVAGASEVWNVDFAKRNLEVGQDNAQLNDLPEEQISFIQSDFFTAAKQLAGIPVKQRVRRGQKPRQFPRIDEKQFDLVYLDPPRWAKSHFGTVDLIRDYPSVLKPSLLATKEGGTLVCTNNVAKVPLDEWLDVIKRCANKAGRPVQDIELLEPETDFPSPDGQYPLKIAVLQL